MILCACNFLQLQDAQSAEELNAIHDALLFLSQYGLTNELVSLNSKHRESISYLQFLQLCKRCVSYVPMENEVAVKSADFFSLINKSWLQNLDRI